MRAFSDKLREEEALKIQEELKKEPKAPEWGSKSFDEAPSTSVGKAKRKHIANESVTIVPYDFYSMSFPRRRESRKRLKIKRLQVFLIIA